MIQSTPILLSTHSTHAVARAYHVAQAGENRAQVNRIAGTVIRRWCPPGTVGLINNDSDQSIVVIVSDLDRPVRVGPHTYHCGTSTQGIVGLAPFDQSKGKYAKFPDGSSNAEVTGGEGDQEIVLYNQKGEPITPTWSNEAPEELAALEPAADWMAQFQDSDDDDSDDDDDSPDPTDFDPADLDRFSADPGPYTGDIEIPPDIRDLT